MTAAAILRLSPKPMPVITVNLPTPAQPYAILVEEGLLARVGDHVRGVAPHRRCLLAMDANVAQPHGALVTRSLERVGYEVATATLTALEQHKTLETVQAVYRVMLDARLERTSPVVALGGGIVGDVAGFAAATYLRGVPLVHVPTTLLAMVDAAIGGKTGVNFPLPDSNDLGKNLIGALWQPKAVLCDPNALVTLQPREVACGLAECVKHAIVADAKLLDWLHHHARDIVSPLGSPSKPRWEELIARSAAIKAAIVAEDEREHGRRALLNLGHTFGHALESISALGLRHGEAVALGLMAAVDVSQATQHLSSESASLIRETLQRCGLPITIGSGGSPDRAAADDPASSTARQVTIDRLMNAMAFDKKVADGRLRLVLPREIGRVEIVDSVAERVIRRAWSALGALP